MVYIPPWLLIISCWSRYRYELLINSRFTRSSFCAFLMRKFDGPTVFKAISRQVLFAIFKDSMNQFEQIAFIEHSG